MSGVLSGRRLKADVELVEIQTEWEKAEALIKQWLDLIDGQKETWELPFCDTVLLSLFL